MDRKQLLQKAENIRANPPAFFQVAGLHELDEVTTVEDHFIKEGKRRVYSEELVELLEKEGL